ncbi:hypothetical protein DL89DRAFT_257940 [Linderina pennispora]|uniref:Uncharacterized protein n=1 Tax=Linderina pennispora TaxID=61395 RepID=A0A1Y1W8J1_9FUNG|nr:uncharacterized protein DL89DRAFT_257940 [Linderina pennispora]ORX69715.1 hypothetical protein DL89DRAFT_257940 [Linderina pennispora]
MKASLILSFSALCVPSLGEPIIKSLLVTLGAEEPMATVASHIASTGASYVVDHQTMLKPVLSYIPGAQIALGAAGIFGGSFAGGIAGRMGGNAVRGFLEGEAGNNIPLAGWIIRDDDEKKTE